MLSAGRPAAESREYDAMVLDGSMVQSRHACTGMRVHDTTLAINAPPRK